MRRLRVGIGWAALIGLSSCAAHSQAQQPASGGNLVEPPTIQRPVNPDTGLGQLGGLPDDVLGESNGGRIPNVIVARVDDEVVLLPEVVMPVRSRLLQAKAQLPASQYRDTERQLLQQSANNFIERLIVLKEFKNKLPDKSVLERIRKMASKDFDSYLLALGRQSGLKTRAEILAQIQKEGSSIDDLRRNFIDDSLARVYLGHMIKNGGKDPTRDELAGFYQQNLDQFRDEKGAIWRQIEIKKGDNPAESLAKANGLQRAIAQGQKFEDLAKQHSQGPTAAAGGLWSLTSPGSYADEHVDQAIFSIPVGQVSPVIEGKASYHILKVERRSDGGPKSFAEVQDLIRVKLRDDIQRAQRKAKLNELMARHYVETIFPQNVAAGTGNAIR